jgi:hypothetical protein
MEDRLPWPSLTDGHPAHRSSQRRQAGSHLGRGPGRTGEWSEAKLPINGQDARWPHRQDARATMASPQHALAILAKS